MIIRISKKCCKTVKDRATITSRLIDNIFNEDRKANGLPEIDGMIEDIDISFEVDGFNPELAFGAGKALEQGAEAVQGPQYDPAWNLSHELDLRPAPERRDGLPLRPGLTCEDLRYDMSVKAGKWFNIRNGQEVTIFRDAPGWMISIRDRYKRVFDRDIYHIEPEFDNIGFYRDHRFNIITHDLDRDILKLWPGGEFVRQQEK